MVNVQIINVLYAILGVFYSVFSWEKNIYTDIIYPDMLFCRPVAMSLFYQTQISKTGAGERR